MSGQLVPANSGITSSFAQQGQVDWVSLSRSTVQISVGALARLSKGGVEAFTVQVGRALCSALAVPAEGQIRLSDAIDKMKKYGSYGEVIWFGFGIKQIVSELAESEEGLALVALCSALSSNFDTFLAARVLRELCLVSGAPDYLKPALHQWKSLAVLCEPILASSHFSLVVNGFYRLLLPSNDSQGKTMRSRISHAELAQAILAVAEVSRGKTLNVTINGSEHCAWLAAFAEWVLGLDVELLDTNGKTLHRSKHSEGRGLAQATFFRGAYDAPVGSPSRAIISRTVTLSGVNELIKNIGGLSIDFCNRRTSWNRILFDTFSTTFIELIEVQNDHQGQVFGDYLRSVAAITGYQNIACDLANTHLRRVSVIRNPYGVRLWSNERSQGLGFLDFTLDRLPELRYRLREGELSRTHIDFKKSSEYQGYGISAYETSLNALKISCSCSRCKSWSPLPGELCLQLLAETIVIYLWTLAQVNLDENVLPSIAGLVNLYRTHEKACMEAKESGDSAKPDLFFAPAFKYYNSQDLELILEVLSGASEPFYTSLDTGPISAVARGGVCLFLEVLRDPTGPPEKLNMIRAVPGYLEHSTGRVERIVDSAREDNRVDWSMFEHQSYFKELVVAETEHSFCLTAAYKVCSSSHAGAFTMLDLRGTVNRIETGIVPLLSRSHLGRFGQQSSITDIIGHLGTTEGPLFKKLQHALALHSNQWWLVDVSMEGIQNITFRSSRNPTSLIWLGRPLVNRNLVRLSGCLACMIWGGLSRHFEYRHFEEGRAKANFPGAWPTIAMQGEIVFEISNEAMKISYTVQMKNTNFLTLSISPSLFDERVWLEVLSIKQR